MISYEPLDEDSMQMGYVMVDKIVRLSKAPDGSDITFIHLMSGEVIRTNDSMRTLQARINSDMPY